MVPIFIGGGPGGLVHVGLTGERTGGARYAPIPGCGATTPSSVIEDPSHTMMSIPSDGIVTLPSQVGTGTNREAYAYG